MSVKHRSRLVCFLLAAAVLLVILTGCSGKMSGRMEIDRNFKGSRVITCSVPTKNLGQVVVGGEETLTALVEEHCPPAFSYERKRSDDALTYYFTIDFADAKSYENIIRTLLPDTALAIKLGDGKLSSGIRLQEDFTDHDLMRWFDEALIASGKYSGAAADIWEFGTTELVLDGKTVCTTQPYAFDTYQGLTLQAVKLKTTVAENGTIERFCDFVMDKTDYEQNKKQFSAYLAGFLPEGGSISFSELEDDTVCETLHYGAVTAEKFEEQTRTLFGSSGLFAASVDMRSAFASETIFSEYLTFEQFPAQEYLYAVKNANTEYAGLSDEFGSAMLGEDCLYYPVENGILTASFSRQDTVTADAVDIDVYFGLEGPQSALVQLTFTGHDALRQAQNAADWYQAQSSGTLTASVIAVHEGYSYLCAVSISGTDAVLSLLDSCFGIRLSYDVEMTDRYFSDRYLISNGVEAASFYEQSGASQISVTTHLPQGMEYDSVRQSGTTIELSGNAYTVWEADTVFRAEASVLRTDRIILVVLIAVLVLFVGLLIVISLSRMYARSKAGLEESFSAVLQQSLQAVFSGKVDAGANLQLIRCFYGKRGPQICVLVGLVIIPLCWSVFYLICYDYANSFYFFSGMLRYVSVTVFLLCGLTVPIALVWRYYQKTGTDEQTVERAGEQAKQMAKTHLAQELMRQSLKPDSTQAAMVPDAFEKRGRLGRRLLAKLLRQISRKFPDVEAPVCILLPDQTMTASRYLLQNLCFYQDRILLLRTLINPSFGTTLPLEELSIPITELRSVTADPISLTARYRDGRLVRTKKVRYLRATLRMGAEKRILLYLPDTAEMHKLIQTLKACLKSSD